MALIGEHSTCVLCGEGIRTKPYMGFTYLGINHPIYGRFDDCAAHKDCLAAWEHKVDFVKYWNKHSIKGHKLKISEEGEVEYRDDRYIVERIIDWVIDKIP